MRAPLRSPRLFTWRFWLAFTLAAPLIPVLTPIIDWHHRRRDRRHRSTYP